MKALVIILLFVWSFQLNAQSNSKFDKDVAIEMMALNNSFSFIKIFGSDSSIIPNDYTRVYRSGIVGLDNQYQIWSKDKVAVISFRGSTSNRASWLENLFSAMIPSTGKMKIKGYDEVNYKFAKDTAAHIHAGWSLGILSMVQDLTYHIKNLNQNGVKTIIFTGHSQGGALAHLARAYFENLPNGIFKTKNQYITYAFASPMPGNKVFADEYNSRFASNLTSFNVVNPKDMVPLLPMTLYNGKLFDPEEVADLLLNSNGSIAGMFAMRLVSKWFIKDPDAYYIQKAGHDIEEEVEGFIGELDMPKYCRDQSYTSLENRMLIGPFEDVVKQLKRDSINIDSLKEIPFYSNNFDIQSGGSVQHKPFNYYLYLLKKYYPEQYALTKERFRVID